MVHTHEIAEKLSPPPFYTFKQQNDVIKTINVDFSLFCSLFRFFLKINIRLGLCAHAQYLMIFDPQSSFPNLFISLKSNSNVRRSWRIRSILKTQTSHQTSVDESKNFSLIPDMAPYFCLCNYAAEDHIGMRILDFVV